MEKKKAPTKATEKGLQVVQKSGYALAGLDAGSELSSELQGVRLKLQRVKVPAGGGLMFESPTENPDEPAMVREIVGVIVHNHQVNSFYRDKYTGGNSAPDCASSDGFNAIAFETGEVKSCAGCPHGKFLKRDDGTKSCDCKKKRKLYLLREGEALPIVFTVPVASVKYFDTYASTIYMVGRKLPSQVVTRISLKKTQNQNGIVYSEAQFGKVRDLEPDEISAVARMRQQTVEMAAQLNDYDGADD